jgi:hypothetical protein
MEQEYIKQILIILGALFVCLVISYFKTDKNNDGARKAIILMIVNFFIISSLTTTVFIIYHYSFHNFMEYEPKGDLKLFIITLPVFLFSTAMLSNKGVKAKSRKDRLLFYLFSSGAGLVLVFVTPKELGPVTYIVSVLYFLLYMEFGVKVSLEKSHNT